MAAIRHAECKRAVERSDRLCADVEVQLEGETQAIVVLFNESEEGEYKLETILKNDADPAIDWYDNDLHAAYVDVTDELFEGQGGAGIGSKESLEQGILAFPGVRESIRSKLAEAKAQKKQELQV
ncbi:MULTISPECIES: hypothetical protein [Paenibacillus]|uniref:hypothetical protein n=1 Tax=Paenibacillus TaxID=44249 RepID=UPI0022B8B885|nr:hypothetical protein [Paenibacillus caseinilyticus]MCZ8518121.1 hypothetical protein [Paenibacillus caseinilyticus]